ncbi:MAG: hypothetical protein M3Z85_00140 [Acidobacteriota bacterium]|nr:hypothetical protein [Acidobacteriota bacterium]
MENFREFDAGPDPFGRPWHVRFKWLQTAISLRHSDTVDVKFVLSDGSSELQKTVSMPHIDLLELSKTTGRKMSDSWCSRLAMLHLRHVIESGEDMEKDMITPSPGELAAYDSKYQKWAEDQVRTKRGAA